MSVTFRVQGMPWEEGPEINMANGNAADVQEYLGLEGVYYKGEDGALWLNEVDPQILLERLEEKPQGGLVRDDIQMALNWTRCGRTPDQVANYYLKLREVAVLARHLGRKVVWE